MAINRCDAITPPTTVSRPGITAAITRITTLARRIVPGVAQMVLHLAFQSALDDYLGQPA
jgi:hypothetical protein